MPLSHIRLQMFLRELDKNPALKTRFHKLLADILKGFDISTLITQTGLSQPHGFFKETIQRIFDKILPRHSHNPNFRELVFFIFPHESDPVFLRHIPAEIQEKLLSLFDPDGQSSLLGRKYLENSFNEKLFDSLEILGSQAYVGSENPELSDRRSIARKNKNRSNPFKTLNSYIYKIVEIIRNKKLIDSEIESLEDEFAEILNDCRNELSQVLSHLEETSVSVDLVYQIEVLHLLLDRIRSLLMIQCFSHGSTGPKPFEFFAYLVEEEQRRRSVRTLISQNVHYLARKIVERSGDTGEHYIARNAIEKHNLFKAALGGGFVTTFTALFKILIHSVHFAPFFGGFFSALNYAGSFAFMQLAHLTLATKQPAMTAAALASKMTTNETSQSELKTEIKNLLKSQTLAAAGNLCAVIPTAYIFSMIWQGMIGSPLLSLDEAHLLIDSHHPFKSLTFFYAILTGVILWTSSIIQGWFDNWMTFRSFADSLTESFILENVLSHQSRKKISKWLQKNLSGIIANIALGSFLAFTPVFGSFFALPLEVRHVTLASGALVFAWSSIPLGELSFVTILWGFLGISMILIGNLITSFTLSLWLATRARGYRFREIRSTLSDILFNN